MTKLRGNKVWLLIGLLTFILSACQSSEDGELEGSTTFASAIVGDLVWDDLRPDGILTEDEPGLAGVTVRLIDPGSDNRCDSKGDTVIQETVTNEQGRYLFVADPGVYCLQFVPPGDYVFSEKDQGDNDAIDSDANPTTGYTDPITLTDDSTTRTVDAALRVPKTLIGDRVFEDLDRDGIQDENETGIEGVTVQLVDPGPDGRCGTADDSVLETTSTDANGFYAFDDLDGGDYCVQFVTPDGLTLSPQNQGGDDSADSDPDPNTGITGVISIGDGETNVSVDAGYFGDQPPPPPGGASLGDLVFNDLDQDGIQDAGEPGIANLQVSLIDPGDDLSCDDSDPILRSTTTNSSGRYAFTGLTPGDYCVMFNAPDGFVFSPANQGDDDASDSDANSSNGKSQVVSLSEGENNPTVDAGVYEPTPGRGSIGDTVFRDTNGNGVQDPGEPGIPNVTVRLKDPGDDGRCGGADDTVLASLTTDADGKYLFSDLAAGMYCVDVFNPSLPSGLTGTTPDPRKVTLNSGQDFLDADFGYEPPPGGNASLGDRVFNDLDEDGIQDPGEPGVAGVTVQLRDCNNTVLRTTTTDNNGNYLFDDLTAGCYRISVVPNGFTFSPQNQGNDDSRDSDIDPNTGTTGNIDLAAGEEDLSNDAGVFTNQPGQGSIGDRVFNDLNQNGVQNMGEPGVAGATVQLRDCNNTVLRTTTTDNNGNYLFDNLEAGCYRISVVRNGFNFSPANQGGDDARDSDVNPDTGTTGNIDLAPGENDTSVDAGVFTPQPEEGRIGDTVFRDTNRNGVQDGGEPGIEGVTVRLRDPGPDGQCGTADDGSVIDIQTTDSNGKYAFDDVEAGTYCVDVNEATLPAGLSLTSGNEPLRVTLGAGQVFLTADFGYGAGPSSIDIQKTPDTQTIAAGASATFSITVRNTGASSLSNVAVADALAPNCNRTVGTLASGASSTYSCTLQNVTADFTNTATVTGQDASGATLTGSDSAAVNVVKPSIDIQKSPDNQVVVLGGGTGGSGFTASTLGSPRFDDDDDDGGRDPCGGGGDDDDDDDFRSPSFDDDDDDGGSNNNCGIATFTITVRNTGETTLNGVTVSDPIAPNCNRNLGTLSQGETTSYTCTLEVSESLTNTADVVGNAFLIDPNTGNPIDFGANGTVRDSDSANVTVRAPDPCPTGGDDDDDDDDDFRSPSFDDDDDDGGNCPGDDDDDDD